MLAQLKKHLTPHELWEDAKFFFLLNLGLVATAVGIAVFKTPNHFAFGGTSGLSIVLATLFPRWNVGAFMWFITRRSSCWGSSFWASGPWGGRSTRRRAVVLRQPV